MQAAEARSATNSRPNGFWAPGGAFWANLGGPAWWPVVQNLDDRGVESSPAGVPRHSSYPPLCAQISRQFYWKYPFSRSKMPKPSHAVFAKSRSDNGLGGRPRLYCSRTCQRQALKKPSEYAGANALLKSLEAIR